MTDFQLQSLTKNISIPPKSFFTEINKWYRVRVKTTNDISGTTEIGCGNTPQKAADDAWQWYKKKSNQREVV